MSKQRKKPVKAWTIVLYLYMLMILLSLFTVATYTWFSISATPRVSDMNMYINSPTGLRLALDYAAPDEDWKLQLDFRDMVDVTTPLRPVTWVDDEQRFYAASYGIDGRLRDYSLWEPLNDQRHANKDNLDGYYIKASFYARTDTPVKVSLSPAVEVDEGINGSGTYVIGTPLWDDQEILHQNGGQGAETAIRIGIRITDLDETGQPTEAEPRFYIYEPNCDAHIDGSEGYVPTPGIRGTENLTDPENMILQTASTWTEAYPVQRNVVVKDLGQFQSDLLLFELDARETVLIEVYIWLEGQDTDCTNKIQDAQIIANIQFSTEPGDQSGLKPIE